LKHFSVLAVLGFWPKIGEVLFLCEKKIGFIIKKKCVSGKTLKTGKSFLLGTIVEPILQKCIFVQTRLL